MKIFDGFTFYNELDLLEIRLATLAPVVDYFILAEATKTFQNNEKPLYFEENKQRFADYQDKIIHIVVDDIPNPDTAFTIENHQRDAISRGLKSASDNDCILISDVDEIPKPERIEEYLSHSETIGFRQQLYYYTLNCACQELNKLPWSMMCRMKNLSSPQKLRDLLVRTQGAELSGAPTSSEILLVEDGGWHFSYLGGIEAIKDKIRSFSHSEYNTAQVLDDARLEQAIQSGGDLFGRGYTFNCVPIDESFPAYILQNRNKFKHLIKNN